jgi:hypothetical protein
MRNLFAIASLFAIVASGVARADEGSSTTNDPTVPHRILTAQECRTATAEQLGVTRQEFIRQCQDQ